MIKRTSIFCSIGLAGIALAASSFTSQDNGQQGNQTEAIKRLPTKEKETVADFTGVAKRALPAVVSIKVQTKQKTKVFGDNSQGLDYYDLDDLWGLFSPRSDSRSKPMVGQASGVIVSPKGYILTNSHVVHGMDAIIVQLTDGREFQAKVLGDDPNSDLAIIKIDSDSLPYLSLGNSDAIQVGQWVAAVGNPFGLQATLTVGVISAKSRNNLDIVRYEDFIQTDAAINRGNSGGPLLNLDGEIIGINTAIATNTSAGYVGIGFAIPSNMAKHVMDEIISGGKISHGFLGVSLQTIDYNLAKAFGFKKVEGALVANVVKDSPAERAGLKIEDIILKFNDHPVESAASLRNAAYMMKPGTNVNLTVMRENQLIQVPLILGNINESVVAAAPLQETKLGIEVETLTPEVAKSLGYAQDEGVVITKVSPSSPASWAGIKKGALIIGINRQKISTVADYNQALASRNKGDPVLLQIRQGDAYIFISLEE